MFIFILTFLKPMSEVDKFAAAHFEYLDKYYASGNFLVSGKQNPWVGGAIICFAKDRVEAEKIAFEDPFHIHEIVKYDIFELEATKWAPAFEHFIKNNSAL